MHGDVSGESVEAFGEVHEEVELFFGAEAVCEGGEFGFFVQGVAEGRGGEAPELFGDGVYVFFLHAEGLSGVPYRSPGAVAVLHAHEADAVGPKRVKIFW